jgi:hypothetical protein
MNLIDTYYHALSRVVPGTPIARSKSLNQAFHSLLYERVRKPRLGLFKADDLLGWSHRAGVKTAHPSFEFRATYTTDHDGRRVSRYGGAQARILVLGCSWAFGHGVDDDDTASARLTAEFHVPAYNLACMGYGPAQNYLMLAHRIALRELTAADAVVAYIWTPDQLIRAWRRREWVELNSWVNPNGPSHPVFDLMNGELHHAGLIGSTDAVTDPSLLPGLTERLEWRTTLALIDAMALLVTHAGRRFLVVVPPVPARERDLLHARRMCGLLAGSNIPFLDLASPKTSGIAPGPLFYRFDGHPTRHWHAIVAKALARNCEIRAPSEGGDTP